MILRVEQVYDGGVVGELTAALDGVCDLEPEALADGDSIVELYRCLARLEAVATRATAAFDTEGQWAADGARSAPAWISVRCRAPKATAAQVSALAGARTPATEEALERDEEMLVGQAATLCCDPFCVELPTPEVAR